MSEDKKIGKVHDFNGFAGKIITEDEQYPFNKNNIFDEIDNDDLVTFVPDYYKMDEEIIKFAKYVRKCGKIIEEENKIKNKK